MNERITDLISKIKAACEAAKDEAAWHNTICAREPSCLALVAAVEALPDVPWAELEELVVMAMSGGLGSCLGCRNARAALLAKLEPKPTGINPAMLREGDTWRFSKYDLHFLKLLDGLVWAMWEEGNGTPRLGSWKTTDAIWKRATLISRAPVEPPLSEQLEPGDVYVCDRIPGTEYTHVRIVSEHDRDLDEFWFNKMGFWFRQTIDSECRLLRKAPKPQTAEAIARLLTPKTTFKDVHGTDSVVLELHDGRVFYRFYNRYDGAWYANSRSLDDPYWLRITDIVRPKEQPMHRRVRYQDRVRDTRTGKENVVRSIVGNTDVVVFEDHSRLPFSEFDEHFVFAD